MAEVQPIKDKNKLRCMADYLIQWDDKYYILFLLGVQSGLRASDILPLKVEDIYALRSHRIQEKKTGKRRFLYLNTQVEKEIIKYINKHNLTPSDYLVSSRKHDDNGNTRPMSRTQAYRVLRTAASACGIDNIGTHTMRKTFGYHYYKKTLDVVSLMRIFNHSSQQMTLKYIGIESEEIIESLKDFYLF